ncbi:HAD family hydrolase [Streptomyces sp. NPDC001127]|uniref:HAD family hydrolase n=1 Tax=Streptomyces sp. NPDC001127 TaxID=3154377 RepID=UPI003331AC97
MENVPRAVLFDLYGTLVRSPTPAERELRRRSIARDVGCDESRLLATYHRAREERLKGTLGSTREALRELLRRAGCEPSAENLERCAQRLLEWTASDLTPPEETLELLDILRSRGWLLGVVSDCEVEVSAVWATSQLSLRFGATAFSCDTGARKPAREQFQICSMRLGVPLDRCVFVGDGGSNELEGACSLDVHAIHLHLPHLNPTLSVGSWGGTTTASVSELLEVLTRQNRP